MLPSGSTRNNVFGIKFHFVNMYDVPNISKYVNAKTKMLWVETPTNPTMGIIDIAACAEISKKNKLMLVVDNTFASPYLQNPLDLGADIVIHSATKYLGGHSDVIHGCLMMNDAALRDHGREPAVAADVLPQASARAAHASFCAHLAHFFDDLLLDFGGEFILRRALPN